MSNFIKVKTTDNTTVLFQKNQIAAIEQVPGTSRSPGYLKVYTGAFSFGLPLGLDDFLKMIGEAENV